LHSQTDAQQKLELRAHLQSLEVLLAQTDLMALEKFAEIRPKLLNLSEDQLGPLEEALQNLELEEADRLCLEILATLPMAY
jgi:hypothetical protein